jgi:hypothetical protein
VAAISISIGRGQAGVAFSDFTTGTLAPNAGDFELRVNTTSSGQTVTTKDAVLACQMFIRQLEGGKLSAFGQAVLGP